MLRTRWTIFTSGCGFGTTTKGLSVAWVTNVEVSLTVSILFVEAAAVDSSVGFSNPIAWTGVVTPSGWVIFSIWTSLRIGSLFSDDDENCLISPGMGTVVVLTILEGMSAGIISFLLFFNSRWVLVRVRFMRRILSVGSLLFKGSCLSRFGVKYLICFRGVSVILPPPSVRKVRTGESSDEIDPGTTVWTEARLPTKVVSACATLWSLFSGLGDGWPFPSKGGVTFIRRVESRVIGLLSSEPLEDDVPVFDSVELLRSRTDVLVSLDMCDIVVSGKLSAGKDKRLAGVSLLRSLIPSGTVRNFQSWKSLGTFVGSSVRLDLSSLGVMFSPIRNLILSGSNFKRSEWW